MATTSGCRLPRLYSHKGQLSTSASAPARFADPMTLAARCIPSSGWASIWYEPQHSVAAENGTGSAPSARRKSSSRPVWSGSIETSSGRSRVHP